MEACNVCNTRSWNSGSPMACWAISHAASEPSFPARSSDGQPCRSINSRKRPALHLCTSSIFGRYAPPSSSLAISSARTRRSSSRMASNSCRRASLIIGARYLNGEFAHPKPNWLLVLHVDVQLLANALTGAVKAWQDCSYGNAPAHPSEIVHAQRISSSLTMRCGLINEPHDKGHYTQEYSCENDCEGPESPRP